MLRQLGARVIDADALVPALIQRGSPVYQAVVEDYVATDKRPLDKCPTDVASCDVCVGIFAGRYGYVPPGQPPGHKRSVTELEVPAAGQSGQSA
ncbi:MAG TPA: DUF4062 domain-containing protein [Anaerolineae bacterium]|nr:DUF4062 domain-containing protein [Anaerolineae bacterium]